MNICYDFFLTGNLEKNVLDQLARSLFSFGAAQNEKKFVKQIGKNMR
jgi:hypothetical protein